MVAGSALTSPTNALVAEEVEDTEEEDTLEEEVTVEEDVSSNLLPFLKLEKKFEN